MGDSEVDKPVTDKPKQARKTYEWPELEVKFIAGPPSETLAAFFGSQGVNVAVGYNHANKEQWSEKKIEYQLKLNERVKELLAEKKALTLVQLIPLVDAEIIRQVRGLQESGDVSMGALETIFKLRLLLTGQPTEHAKYEHEGLDGTEESDLRKLLRGLDAAEEKQLTRRNLN